MILQDEALLKRIEHCNWVVFVLLTSGCFAFLSPKFALGVSVGGMLAIANFFLMKRNLSRALDTKKRRRFAVLVFAQILPTLCSTGQHHRIAADQRVGEPLWHGIGFVDHCHWNCFGGSQRGT
jgi:hypothetical protein